MVRVVVVDHLNFAAVVVVGRLMVAVVDGKESGDDGDVEAALLLLIDIVIVADRVAHSIATVTVFAPVPGVAVFAAVTAGCLRQLRRQTARRGLGRRRASGCRASAGV